MLNTYFAFWFRYVYPNADLIESGKANCYGWHLYTYKNNV